MNHRIAAASPGARRSHMIGCPGRAPPFLGIPLVIDVNNLQCR